MTSVTKLLWKDLVRLSTNIVIIIISSSINIIIITIGKSRMSCKYNTDMLSPDKVDMVNIYVSLYVLDHADDVCCILVLGLHWLLRETSGSSVAKVSTLFTSCPLTESVCCLLLSR